MQDFWQRRKGKLYFAGRVWNSSSWWLLFCCRCCWCPCGATNLQRQKRGTRAFRTLRVFWRTFGGTFKVLFEWRTLSTCAAWSSGIRKCHNHQMHKSSVKTKDVKMWNPNLHSFNFQAEKDLKCIFEFSIIRYYILPFLHLPPDMVGPESSRW